MKEKWTNEEIEELLKLLKFGKKKKIESSKVILLMIGITAYILLFIGTILAWKGDSSILQILTTGTVSGFSVGIGFYYWKARRENEIKLKAIYKDDYVVDSEEKPNDHYLYQEPIQNATETILERYGTDYGTKDISNGV